MILHFWMHWFWITTSIKCLMVLAVQMISLSCFLHPLMTEAGLLDNETLILDSITLNKTNKSSQTELDDITLPFAPISSLHSSASSTSSASVSLFTSALEDTIDPTAQVTSSTSDLNSKLSNNSDWLSREATITLGKPFNMSQSVPEEYDLTSKISVSDVEDTFNGGILDAYQYPTKKVPKVSNMKNNDTQARTMEEGGEEIEEVKLVSQIKGEERKENEIEVFKREKSETFKIVKKETVKINISSVEGDSSITSTERTNVTQPLESTIISSSTKYTLDVGGAAIERKSGNISERVTVGSTAAYESKDLPLQSDNVTFVSNESWTNGSRNGNETYIDERKPLEDQGGVEDTLKDTLKNDSLIIENKIEESMVRTTIEPFLLRNRVAAATSAQNFELNQSGMNAGSVTGIALSILVIFGLFGVIVFVLYRRRYLNKPQVLHDKCSNLDSSGYIDDTSLRDNSEEMYSLDNDSFLNSLEAMTIQNYWTESVKHTKL